MIIIIHFVMSNKKVILGLSFIAILLASSPIGSVANEMLFQKIDEKQNSSIGTNVDEKTIKILFDPNNKITKDSAQEFYARINPFYENIEIIPITTISELKEHLTFNQWILFYFFHGSEKGLFTGTELISWENLSTEIEKSLTKTHIFESCYSSILEEIEINNKEVHGLNAQTDAKLAILDGLCQLYELIAKSNLKDSTLKDNSLTILSEYFISNVADILMRAMEPIEPLAFDFEVEFQQQDTLIRGSWGWLVQALVQELIGSNINSLAWYTILTGGTTSIGFDTAKILTGLTDSTEITLTDLAKGDSETGDFPFDIPLDMDVTPKYHDSGPWYLPEYVDLKMTIKPENGKLDLADLTGLRKMVEAAGYSIQLDLEPKLYGAIRIGNYVQAMVDANSNIAGNPIQFLGGGFTLKLSLEIGVPLAMFLDAVIPGSGTTISKVLKLLNIKVELLNLLSLGFGMNYNSTIDASTQDVDFRIGLGLLIDAKLPSLKALIKKAIGFDLPLDFIQLGIKLRGTTGLFAKASFSHEGDSFSAGLYYTMLFKFWAKLFWFLKFSVTKSWKDDITFLEIQGEGTAFPPKDDHANLDLDNDGLWDSLETSMGLNSSNPDTDGDGLYDGNEIFFHFTDPTKIDTDGDNLNDKDEIARFINLGLDPYADYDGDGLPCVMDPDSDNDMLGDYGEIMGNTSNLYGELFTNPSMPDTDLDGLSDYDEYFRWDDAQLEYAHCNPTDPDTDDDGILDGKEDQWFRTYYGVAEIETINYLLDNDSDDDLLLDGLELMYNTDPRDIDTDDDYDLDNDQVINASEIILGGTDGIVEGNLTDYWEIMGQNWPNYPWNLTDCIPALPIKTNPLKADSDGDGLTDGDEWRMNEMPIYLDSDGDGISNLVEHAWNINCTQQDTDSDFLPDGVELLYFNGRGFDNATVVANGYLNNSDVDNDGILDGHELQLGTDPLNNDTDFDGLMDGAEMESLTSPLIEDCDNDGLLDGIEVLVVNTNPLKYDSDSDGLSDFVEVNEGYLDILNVGEVYYFTDPNDPDSDDDLITDGEEVYGWDWSINRTVSPGSLVIDYPLQIDGERVLLHTFYLFPDPYRARFQTNPVNADTDSDGLPDGLEKMMVLSPISNDTDGDNWLDADEMSHMESVFSTDWSSVPYDTWHYLDFDGDGLTDFEEVMFGTNIFEEDTDYDGLSDYDEVKMPVTFAEFETENFDPDGNITIETNNTSIGIRKYTEPTLSDTDSDGLLDGEELYTYGTDPTNPDTDFDGISDYDELHTYRYFIMSPYTWVHLDPLDSDTDSDGIPDGEEVDFFTIQASERGDPNMAPLADFDLDGKKNIFDPDSDGDGIYDGIELHTYTNESWGWHPLGTDPLNSDQDANSILDGQQTDFDFDGLSDHYEVTTVVANYAVPNLNDDINTTFSGYHQLLNHTLFLVQDTDDDGFSDGEEVLNYQTDPLNPESKPFYQVQIVQGTELTFNIGMLSTSTISNFVFVSGLNQLEFDVTGDTGTEGISTITVERELLDAQPDEWIVFLDGIEIPSDIIISNTHTTFNFGYSHSTHHVIIRGTWSNDDIIDESSSSTDDQGENTSGYILATLFSSMVAVAFVKRRRIKK